MTARARALPVLSRVQHIRSRLLSFTSQHKCLLSMRCLGTKVDIRQSSRGRGQIVIHFRNHEEFERLSQLIQDSESDQQQSFAG